MTQDRDDSPMHRSGPQECAYLTRRAEAHAQLAVNAGDSESRLIHERLERLYREQVRRLTLVLPD